MAIINERDLQDLNLSASIALPAAGASADTPSINLATTTSGRARRVELLVSVPATPSLVDTKTITFTVQDSADNSSFAAVADLPAIVSTGAGGVGAAAISRRFKLPIGLRQYIRLDIAVLAAGGNNTAIVATIVLVF